MLSSTSYANQGVCHSSTGGYDACDSTKVCDNSELEDRSRCIESNGSKVLPCLIHLEKWDFIDPCDPGPMRDPMLPLLLRQLSTL
jgi:hypothetical protein